LRRRMVGFAGNDVFVELSNDYAKNTFEEQVTAAVVMLAAETSTPLPTVWDMDWDLFRASLEALARLKEEEVKAARRRSSLGRRY